MIFKHKKIPSIQQTEGCVGPVSDLGLTKKVKFL